MHPSQYYSETINRLNAQLALLKRKRSVIAWTRLATLIAVFVAGYFLLPVGIIPTLVPVVLLLILFGRLVAIAADNRNTIDNLNRLLEINHTELGILDRRFTQLPNGAELFSPTHDYAVDLDLFGHASLYQYINRTNTEQGNQILASWLLQASPLPDLLPKQEAVKELATKTAWRQQLQAFGKETTIRKQTELNIQSWLKEENSFSKKQVWKILRFAYPAFTLLWIIAYATDLLPASFFYVGLLLFVFISGKISELVTPQYSGLDKMVKEVSVLNKIILHIESLQINSSYAQQLQRQLFPGGIRASVTIKKLAAILDRFDYRLNPLVFIPVNSLLLWDLQQVFQLEAWRTKYAATAGNWFTIAGEFEAICTLATLHFNHPDWCFPEFDKKNYGTFDAREIGHPLLPEAARVCSSFSTAGDAQIALVTGSNMAGKSTFLRSIGINLVLALAGAPVCAQKLTVSYMRLISSMRIADNLEESTSTFYAELKKLKRIIDAVNAKEPVFLLLDEILRGTNSLDRHTGSVAFVKQLIRHGASGILATHDIDLASLINEFPAQVHNYHFDVQVKDEELFFDYKLKEGVCTSMNASILMKKIGIEL